MKIPPWLVAPPLNALYRLWCSTLRYTETGREPLDALEAAGKPTMLSLWHDELFALMHVRGTLRIVTVVSKSKDGEYLARLLQALGIATARGSNSRGGISALLQASRLMREKKYNGCITVDGPRGPRHEVKDGAIFLAFRTPAPIIPIRLYMQRAKVFRSWDRFQLPLPFSRVHIVYGEPYMVSATELSENELERERKELQRRLNELRPPGPEESWFGRGPGEGRKDKPLLRARAKEMSEKLQYRLFKALASFMTGLSAETLRGAAAFFAFCFWHLAASRRREAIQAVKKHLKVSDSEARRIARQSFKENFISFLEIFHSGKFFTDQSVKAYHTPEAMAMFAADAGPVVVATAHIGSWEMMEGLCPDLRPESDGGMVVVRSQKNKALNRLMAELRGARGMLVIDHRKASELVLPGLRAGGTAAFLVDHNCGRGEAVFLPFLEDMAAVNKGPAALALRAKATLYPIFLLRDKNGGHIMHTMPPLRTSELEGTISERVTAIARYYTDAVAEIVRLYPEQWFWMHKRWKTRRAENKNPHSVNRT